MQVKDYAGVLKEIVFNDRNYKDAGKAFKELLPNNISNIGIFATAATALFAAYKTYKAVDNQFGLSYEGAFGNTEKSLKNVQNTKSEIDDLISKTDEYKQSLENIANNNDIDISGLDSIDDIIQKINSTDGISLIDQAEVQKIQTANTQLEATLRNKQNILTQEEKESKEKAQKALKKTVNPTSSTLSTKLSFGADVDAGALSTPTGASTELSVLDATKQDLSAYQKYKDKIEKLQKKQIKNNNDFQNQINKAQEKDDPDKVQELQKEKTKQSDKIDKQIKDAQATQDRLNSSLSSRQEELSTILSALSENGEGITALSGAETDFSNVKSIVDAISSKDLSSTEKALNSLDSYFDGSIGKNAIKQQLQDAVDSGNDLEQALSRIGLSLDDLGIDKISQLKDYLDETSTSAKKTKDYLDGTASSVDSAFNEDNQDSEWSSMSDYLSKANSLYEKSKIGTDDFQESTQYMFYKKIDPDKKGIKFDAEAYAEKWDEANEKRKRYFDADNPMDSANNFIDDLEKNGLAKRNSDDSVTWTKDFESSAQAAEKLNLSVSATETLMKNLQSYGYEFAGMDWNGENLTQFKDSLSKIRDIYNQMDEGSEEKKTLGKKIQGWDENVAQYNKDMSKLTKDQVVKIKFEYDLASIQQEIQKLQKIADEGGDSQTWAELNAEKSIYRDKAETAKGNKVTDKKEGSKDYQKTTNTIDALKDQLSKAKSDKDKAAIQSKISAGYDLQNKMNQAYMDSNMSWKDFVKSKDYTNIAKELKDYTEKTKKEVADILGVNESDITKEKTKKTKKKSKDKSKKDSTGNSTDSGKSDKKSKDTGKETVDKKVNIKVDTKELDKIDSKIDSEGAKQKIVELIGKDNATPVIEKWDSMDAPDKNTALSGKDQATAIVSLWNAMSASDKFTNLTAEDKATALVSIWNDLLPEQKTAIINGDSSVAEQAIASVNSTKVNDKSFTITANDKASKTVRSIRSEISSVTGKTVTITTVHNEKTVKSTEYKQGASQRFSSNGHKSHKFNGTFHPSSIPAKVQGTLSSFSVGIPKSEKTLINEVGTEGVVRDGKLNVYNNGYPALVDLHRGDVVFNHFEKSAYIW